MLYDQCKRRNVLQCEQLEDRLTLDASSFVTSLYLNLLNRAPDAGGLAFYVGEINNGVSNQTVASQIWGSPEHRGIEVDFFYQTLLHRSADAGGRAFWVNELLSGAQNEQGVIIGFLFSPEFVAAHSTPAAYVSTLYIDILGRLPSAAELVTWENDLQLFGGRTVSAAILTSTESYVDIISKDYVQFLSRTPDLNGLAFWLSRLQTNQGTIESVAEGILGSAEYAADH
jgi:hypothetical protein